MESSASPLARMSPRGSPDSLQSLHLPPHHVVTDSRVALRGHDGRVTEHLLQHREAVATFQPAASRARASALRASEDVGSSNPRETESPDSLLRACARNRPLEPKLTVPADKPLRRTDTLLEAYQVLRLVSHQQSVVVTKRPKGPVSARRETVRDDCDFFPCCVPYQEA